MTLSIGIFSVSLLGIIAFFSGKSFEIRTGRRFFVSSIGEGIEKIARRLAIVVLPHFLKLKRVFGRERAIFYLRFFLSKVHNFFRGLINSSEGLLIGWTDVIRGKRIIKHKSSASFFLRDIAEYKSQLPKNR